MKKIIALSIFAAVVYATAIPSFSADTAALEETTPPAANGPLEASSITPPKDAMPKASTQPVKTTPSQPTSMYAPAPPVSTPGTAAEPAMPAPAAPTPPPASPSPAAKPAPPTPDAPPAKPAMSPYNALPAPSAPPVQDTNTPRSSLPNLEMQ